MLYREIEDFLKTEFRQCFLNKWVVDCGGDNATKIIAFNFFCEMHFENISRKYLKEIVKILENRILETFTSKSKLDIIDKTKDILDTNFPHLWKARKTKLDYNSNLSTIMIIDDIRSYAINKTAQYGTNYKKKSYQLVDEKTIKETISKFKESKYTKIYWSC